MAFVICVRIAGERKDSGQLWTEEGKDKVDAKLKAFLLVNRLCPKDGPLIRASFCPKIKKSCFSLKGNGCEFSIFPLLSIESLSDRVKTQWGAYQRTIREKACQGSLKNKKAGIGDQKDVIGLPMSADSKIS